MINALAKFLVATGQWKGCGKLNIQLLIFESQTRIAIFTRIVAPEDQIKFKPAPGEYHPIPAGKPEPLQRDQEAVVCS